MAKPAQPRAKVVSGRRVAKTPLPPRRSGPARTTRRSSSQGGIDPGKWIGEQAAAFGRGVDVVGKELDRINPIRGMSRASTAGAMKSGTMKNNPLKKILSK